MNVTIIGGDGFIGWPLALRLSRDHQVTIIDNLSRRRLDKELETQSLTPIALTPERAEAWKKHSAININFVELDAQSPALVDLLRTITPDAIVHLGEVRSAPYSMLSSNHRTQTVTQNISTTQNILEAIIQLSQKCHLIHIGFMGVYGYSSTEVVDERVSPQDTALFRFDPGSVYHLSKVLDHHLLRFYAKNWGIGCTELHQGIVWGTQTSETLMAPQLVNRYDYDGEYGTVVNRFLVQAATGHPLTLYGKGHQQRAFLHLCDAVRCIEWCVANPSAGAAVRVFNQFSEIPCLSELADMIAQLSDARIEHVPNPREEDEANILRATSSLWSHVKPAIHLKTETLEAELAFARSFADSAVTKTFRTKALWKKI